MRTVLLIDTDVLRYQFAFINTKTIDWEDDSEKVAIVNPEKARDDLRVMIEELLTKFKALDFMLPISDSAGNFRKRVLKTYKLDRVGKEKPALWYELDAYLRAEYGHKISHLPKLEGDDLLGLYATEPDTNERRIMVSIDKDMQTVPGWLYNPNKPELGLRLITEFDANRYWMFQTLTGDPTDNYSGCPGIGPKKAEVILDDAVAGLDASGVGTPAEYLREMWAAVVATYEAKGLTKKDALVQARCARILRHGDFNFDTGRVKLWKPPSIRSRSSASRSSASPARPAPAKTPSPPASSKTPAT